MKHHNIGLGPYHAAHPSSRIVHPASLRLTEDGVLTDGNSTFNQALLQLHQYEIEDMDEEVLLALARICHNDLRTIYIVHDKRILGLIRRELPWLMAKGFITQHQASCLANGIAETHLPGDSMFHELAMVPGLGPEEKDKWTLKICTSGKGDGMVLGKDVDRDSWNKLLLAQSDTTPCSSASRDQPYLLQRYYPSKTVNLLVDGDDGSPQHVSWNIVGTILIINRTLIGNTGFRTSISDIISLSSNIKGKCMVGATTPGIPPTLTLPAKAPRYLVPPKTAIIAAPPHSPSAEHAAAVQASLTNHGLAIIILPDADPRSDYLVSITQLLGCPLAHSAQHGILWDVAPSPTLSSGARSHTSATFPWHTDCSFERSPPRFFGLHIVRHDRFGGGTLRLLPTDDILAALPPAVLDTLRAPVFRFDVPREFDKGESSTTGAVLSGPKIRWRREIMHGVTAEAQTALDAVEKALDEIDDNAYVLGPDLMRPGVVVCIDNGRFLHARSQVKDPERLLRRVRWGAEEF